LKWSKASEIVQYSTSPIRWSAKIGLWAWESLEHILRLTHNMPRTIGWLGDLIERLNVGCANSPFLEGIGREADFLVTGKRLCLLLWPFMSILPGNVQGVSTRLPEDMDWAKKFFNQLKDEHGYYQNLWIKQSELLGASHEELLDFEPDVHMQNLVRLISQYCSHDDFKQGILAIVTAELAATIFSRHALPHVEQFYSNNPPTHSTVSLEEGLAWLRLHAKPHPRHALWMKRTIESIEHETEQDSILEWEQNGRQEATNRIPEPVDTIASAVLKSLRSNESVLVQPTSFEFALK